MAAVNLKDLAKRGAAEKVTELRTELAAIYRAFPALRKGSIDAPFTRRLRATNGGRRSRKPMTAAQRRAVSVRMKKYWAARRARKG